jgi:hypothetical protein
MRWRAPEGSLEGIDMAKRHQDLTVSEGKEVAMETSGRVRPRGVTVLAVVAVVAGLFDLLLTVLLATSRSGSIRLRGYQLEGEPALLVVVAVAWFAFAYGAWTLSPWAWYLGLAIAGLMGVAAIINGTVIAVGIALLIASYLLRAEVRAAFGRR